MAAWHETSQSLQDSLDQHFAPPEPFHWWEVVLGTELMDAPVETFRVFANSRSRAIVKALDELTGAGLDEGYFGLVSVNQLDS